MSIPTNEEHIGLSFDDNISQELESIEVEYNALKNRFKRVYQKFCTKEASVEAKRMFSLYSLD